MLTILGQKQYSDIFSLFDKKSVVLTAKDIAKVLEISEAEAQRKLNYLVDKKMLAFGDLWGVTIYYLNN